MWTSGYGGNGGEPFEIFNDDYKAVGIKGRSGDWLDQLSFDFTNTKTGEF